MVNFEEVQTTINSFLEPPTGVIYNSSFIYGKKVHQEVATQVSAPVFVQKNVG